MDLDNRVLGRVLAETIELPKPTRHPVFGSYLKPGPYDEKGAWITDLAQSETGSRQNPQARVVIEFAGVNVIWGRSAGLCRAGR